jgi:putative transposase
LVFCPKYRYRVLDGEIGQFVKQQIEQLLPQKDQAEVIELNVQVDHVHLVASIPPKYAVSDIMVFLKGKLALKIFAQYPQFGRKYWGRHLWARGYCASTVGIDEEMIRQYVLMYRSTEI